MAIRRSQPYDTTLAQVDVEQVFTAQQTPMNGLLADNTTVVWDGDINGQVVEVTLAGNRALAAPTNVNNRTPYLLIVIQDATGGRTLTFNTAYKFAGGSAPTLSGTPNAVDIFSFIGGTGNIMRCTGKSQDVK